MAETYATLSALFKDIADAIREKTGDTASIIADDFPDVIRERLQVIPPPIQYLTFSSPSSFTLAVYDTTKHWDGTLEYSTDTSTWSTWDGTTTLSSAISGSDNVLYMRGAGNTVITGEENNNYCWVLTGSDISCSGNIETLLDHTTVEYGGHPAMGERCYYGLFNKCTSLTQAPELPATTLTTSCYRNMFIYCSGLLTAPALPATIMASNCYRSMFNGCSKLVQIPELPATTLADYCYAMMFYSCRSLFQVPALPATTLASNCYYQMFYLTNNSFYLSSTQDDTYTIAYRIPMTGTGTTATNALTNMFNQGTRTPSIDTTYYLRSDGANAITVVYPTISFMIGSTSYQAKGVMTWAEWINSSYCTDSGRYTVRDSCIWDNLADGSIYMPSDMVEVAPSDAIIAGAAYRLL